MKSGRSFVLIVFKMSSAAIQRTFHFFAIEERVELRLTMSSFGSFAEPVERLVSHFVSGVLSSFAIAKSLSVSTVLFLSTRPSIAARAAWRRSLEFLPSAA